MTAEGFPPDCAAALGWEDTIGCTACATGTVVCTTAACPAYGMPVRGVFCRNADGVLRSSCGRCGRPNQITEES